MRKQFFAKKLMEWFSKNHRPFPWKEEKNPYLVWLSEIILQQTRVSQGLPYFERFREKYPTVKALADASEDAVMKLWEGLGYYSRARNLHFTAKYIADELEGVFPSTYEEILALKGVGPYTAAAIASFAFDLPHAVVDGNVYRVLTRFFGIEQAIDSTAGKKVLGELAQDLLDHAQPARFNQAIMDFGATHCTPSNPKCGLCPMREHCLAFRKKLVEKLPLKSKRIVRRERFFNYLIINEEENIFLRKRTKKDIWQGLYEFPLYESESLLEEKEMLFQSPVFQEISDPSTLQLVRVSKAFRQILSHQKIVARFWEFDSCRAFDTGKSAYFKAERKNLSKFAFPKIIDWYLRDKSLTLKLL